LLSPLQAEILPSWSIEKMSSVSWTAAILFDVGRMKDNRILDIALGIKPKKDQYFY